MNAIDTQKMKAFECSFLVIPLELYDNDQEKSNVQKEYEFFFAKYAAYGILLQYYFTTYFKWELVVFLTWHGCLHFQS